MINLMRLLVFELIRNVFQATGIWVKKYTSIVIVADRKWGLIIMNNSLGISPPTVPSGSQDATLFEVYDK